MPNLDQEEDNEQIEKELEFIREKLKQIQKPSSDVFPIAATSSLTPIQEGNSQGQPAQEEENKQEVNIEDIQIDLNEMEAKNEDLNPKITEKSNEDGTISE
mmetsp:Transcript_9353/g.8832  ORF Transcript_9353/g.8832 Transcript_9353/m.8832 type:complete len:101 (+) Transcript_9353:1051-1353(+)